MELNFNIEAWPWKIAVVVALLGMREFVRLLSPKETVPQTETGETSKWLIETIDSAAIAIGLVLFVIQPFILQAFYIPSGSMEDTLRISDRLLVSRMVYRIKQPEFQDVIVFKAPPDALINQTQKDVDFIKRCMGLPNDEIHVINRQVFRNGKPVAEPYTKWNEAASASTLPAVADATSPDAFTKSRYSYDMKIVGGAVYSREYDPITNQPEPWTQNNLAVSPEDQAKITAAPYDRVPPGRYLMFGDHRSNSNDGHVWGFVPRENIVGKAICVFWPPTRLGLVDKMSFNQRK